MVSTSVRHIGSGWRIARIAPKPARLPLGLARACRGRSRPRRSSACSRRRCGRRPRRSRRTGSRARGRHRGRSPCHSAPRSGGIRARPADAAAASGRRRVFRAHRPLSARGGPCSRLDFQPLGALVRGAESPVRLRRWGAHSCGHRSRSPPPCCSPATPCTSAAASMFVLAAAALAPLAFVIGEATENLSLHAGPAIGAFVEREPRQRARADHRPLRRRATASRTSCAARSPARSSRRLLLVGGGGDARRWRRRRSTAARSFPSSRRSSLAVVLFLMPALPGAARQPRAPHALPALAACRGRRRSASTSSSPPPTCATAGGRRSPSCRRRPGACAARSRRSPPPRRPRRRCPSCSSARSRAFGRSLGLSQFFVAAVIVALVGNAAEQGGAIVVARRGNPGLGTEIAIASATQILVFVCPLVVLASGLLGRGLPLSFGVGRARRDGRRGARRASRRSSTGARRAWTARC